MTLYLFRHAAVEDKYRGCYNGHIDIPISKEGLKEAKECFKTIEDINFDAIFCSTLQRAKQTLKSFSLKKEAVFSDLLREKSWGRHEGKSYDEVVAMEGASYENFEQWIKDLDGESYEDFTKKISQFLSQIKLLKADNILLVSHAGVIYTLIHLIKKCSLEEAFGINISYGDYYELNL